MVRSSRSRSTSTHCPRNSTKPSVPASSVVISCSLRRSPSSVISTEKSSNLSSPSLEGARAPTVAVTCGRAGRLARHVAGMRTTTPALCSSAALASRRAASCGVQRSGWKISPASTIGRSQAHVSAARCTGISSESSLPRFAEPAYSRSAWPSGTCCALACVESCVV